MKIITNDGVWIQNKDAKIICDYEEFHKPSGLKLISNYWSYRLWIENDKIKYDIHDPYKFFLITDKDTIKTLTSENFDWILDYDKVKDLTAIELLDLAYKLLSELQEIEFINENDKKNGKCIEANNWKEYCLKFKIRELNDVIIFRRNKSKKPITESEENPDNYKQLLLCASNIKLPEGVTFKPLNVTKNYNKEAKKLVKKYNLKAYM